MYVETDFLLALIKDDDWLGEAAEGCIIDLESWTSPFALIKLLLVAYRESLDAERVVANAAELVPVRGDMAWIMAAATYVSDHGFTPFDALHLVESKGATIVSSDDTYEAHADTLDLKTENPEDGQLTQ